MNTQKQTLKINHTNTTNTINGVLDKWTALAKRSELFLTYILFPPQTENITLSASLLTNGRQLGSSEYDISHCPLCPVKLSTELCMIIIAPVPQ